jgi:hypothetical protein
MKTNTFNKISILILLLLAMETSFGQTSANAVGNQSPSAALTEQIKIGEEKLQRLEEKTTKYKELYAREMVSRLELEAAQTEAEKERLNLAKLRSESENDAKMALLTRDFASENEVELFQAFLKDADGDLTKIRKNLKDFKQFRETQYLKTTASFSGSGGYERRTNAFARFAGSGRWSIQDAGQIQEFFQSKFRRNLPISAFGQSGTHNRLGFDHRNAMDVALHPDSIEGRTLIAYLESRNIPFAAFRQAIPGSATGPHIHIGVRSNRFR